MEYTHLGASGVVVSRVCLGTMTYGTPEWRPWVLDEETSRPLIRRALQLGVNFFDTVDMYSHGLSEEVLGRALRDFGRREKVVLATKVYFPMGPGQNERGLSRCTSFGPSTIPFDAWVRTTSIYTRSTAGTRKHRSRRRWKLCTTS